jgi:hypothetical protein
VQEQASSLRPPEQEAQVQQAPQQVWSPDQLNNLVAPIALYPDPLLVQLQVASTYPLEIVEANQWLQQKGTSGYVDLVITPTCGLGMIVLEDVLDKYLLKKLEQRTNGVGKRSFYRIVFNPGRSLTNFLRGKVPWHRDSRPIS